MTYCGTTDRCGLANDSKIWNATKRINNLFGGEGKSDSLSSAPTDVQTFAKTFGLQQKRSTEVEMAACMAFRNYGALVSDAGCSIAQEFWNVPPQSSWLAHSLDNPSEDVLSWEDRHGHCACNVSTYWKMELVGQAGRGYPSPQPGMAFVSTQKSRPKRGMACEVVTVTRPG